MQPASPTPSAPSGLCGLGRASSDVDLGHVAGAGQGVRLHQRAGEQLTRFRRTGCAPSGLAPGPVLRRRRAARCTSAGCMVLPASFHPHQAFDARRAGIGVNGQAHQHAAVAPRRLGGEALFCGDGNGAPWCRCACTLAQARTMALPAIAVLRLAKAPMPTGQVCESPISTSICCGAQPRWSAAMPA